VFKQIKEGIPKKVAEKKGGGYSQRGIRISGGGGHLRSKKKKEPGEDHRGRGWQAAASRGDAIAYLEARQTIGGV